MHREVEVEVFLEGWFSVGVAKRLFGLAKHKSVGRLIGTAFAYFPYLIPVNKIAQSKKAVAFYHPSPSYPEHVLIIPRKVARTVFSLSTDDFCAVIEMAARIRRDMAADYSIVINGGDRQDVMQAHFHLFSGNLALKKGLDKGAGMVLPPDGEVFWERLAANMNDSIVRSGLTPQSFSLLVQVAADTDVLVYFV